MANASARARRARDRFDPETALAALCSIADAAVCTDSDRCITFMNRVAEKLTGWTAAQAAGRELGEVLKLFDEELAKAAFDPVAQCVGSGGTYIRESGLLLLTRSGSAYDIGLSVAPIKKKTAKQAGYVILFNNVTEIRASQKKLAHSALHDALTGLPNRESFVTSLRAAIDQARAEDRRHVLCFIDLDRFKRVNDNAGHAAGDALLAEVGKLIARACMSKDVAARLGGDEFALLIRDSTVAEAERTAEGIVRAIANMAFRWEAQVFRIGASVGAAIIARDSPALGEILHQADKACYAAKQSGRNRVCVYDRNRRPVFERFPPDADASDSSQTSVH